MYIASSFSTEMLEHLNANITVRPLKTEDVCEFFTSHPIRPCDGNIILNDGDSIIVVTRTPQGTRWALVVVRHPS